MASSTSTSVSISTSEGIFYSPKPGDTIRLIIPENTAPFGHRYIAKGTITCTSDLECPVCAHHHGVSKCEAIVDKLLET
jgi:hypothetical protein